MIVLAAVMILTASSAIADTGKWNCPECGEKNNTGNYCGQCGQPAPVQRWGTWGKLSWKLNVKGTLIISGSGEMNSINENNKSGTWLKYANDIQNVIVKEGITGIGANAFAGCLGITEVLLPDRLRTIGKGAFENCVALKDIILPESVRDIGEAAFKYCTSIEKMEIPAGVKVINSSTFAYCSGLKSITIPNGVTTIGAWAFSYSGLVSLDIPGSVQPFGQIIDHCSALKEIQVDPANTAYVSVDGVLYTKNMKTVMKYPAKKTGESYMIPDGVVTIFDNAFENCALIKEISIPRSVKYIEINAFFNCSRLKTVNYSGTVEEKKTIRIGEYNESLQKANWQMN